jgi:hypothetical protein
MLVSEVLRLKEERDALQVLLIPYWVQTAAEGMILSLE